MVRAQIYSKVFLVSSSVKNESMFQKNENNVRKGWPDCVDGVML